MRRVYLVSLTLATALWMAWHASPCVLGVVMGKSMEPTLQSGQVIAIDRHYYRTHRPRPGEIVVFRYNGETYVKRVYAVEGQTIHLLAEGRGGAPTLVQPIRPGHEGYVAAAAARSASLAVRKVKVPEGCFYALGDCLSNSIDSRELGPIDARSIIGRVRVLGQERPAPDFELQLFHAAARRQARL